MLIIGLINFISSIPLCKKGLVVGSSSFTILFSGMVLA
jgi:hypothetical protein